jgi:hypothetical protein
MILPPSNQLAQHLQPPHSQPDGSEYSDWEGVENSEPETSSAPRLNDDRDVVLELESVHDEESDAVSGLEGLEAGDDEDSMSEVEVDEGQDQAALGFCVDPNG